MKELLDTPGTVEAAVFIALLFILFYDRGKRRQKPTVRPSRWGRWVPWEFIVWTPKSYVK